MRVRAGSWVKLMSWLSERGISKEQVASIRIINDKSVEATLKTLYPKSGWSAS